MGVRAPATMTDVDTANLLASVTRNLVAADRDGDRAVRSARWTRSSPPRSPARPATSSPRLPLPERYRAAYVRREDAAMFDGVASEDKDPRKSDPRRRGAAARARTRRGLRRGHGLVDQLQHRVDVDLRAAVRRSGSSTGSAASRSGARATRSTTTWWARTPRASCCGWAPRCAAGAPGDRVTVHCNYVDDQDPTAHDDSMLAVNQRIWGFETNFGGLADVAVVKANQLMPKPTHLTLGGGGGQRAVQLDGLPDARLAQRRARHPGRHACSSGARRAGSASFAVQYVLNGGGTPGRRRVVGVAAPRCCASSAASTCIDRAERGYRFWSDEHTQDESEWRRLGADIRALAGTDPDIVFEHPGRQTMGASVFVCTPWRHDRHVRGDDGLHDRVRQPAPLDEAEDDQGQPLLQLPRGVGREPARLRGQDHPAALGGLHPRAGRARRRCRSTATSRRASSACCASHRPRGSASTTPRGARAVGEDAPHDVPAARGS